MLIFKFKICVFCNELSILKFLGFGNRVKSKLICFIFFMENCKFYNECYR